MSNTTPTFPPASAGPAISEAAPGSSDARFAMRQPSAPERGERKDISALYRLTDRLFRASTVVEAYEAAFAAIGELLNSARASILQADEAGIMRLVASKGVSEGCRRAISEHFPSWQDGCHAEPLLVSDVTCCDALIPLREVLATESIAAIAFIPLTADEAVIGTLMVYYDQPVEFTERDWELALLIARQLSAVTHRYQSDQAAARLAALVESSDDAILSMDPCGTIRSWNNGAERLFGYAANEMIGQPVTALHPVERQDKEASILSRIRSGQRLRSYETVRRCKNGSLVDVSLTVSPILDPRGEVVGISKIARDISERRAAQAQRDLLLREMTHRIKNLFALTNSLVRLGAHSARTPRELADDVAKRMEALSRAHDLTMQASVDTDSAGTTPTLQSLIATILSPYDTHHDTSVIPYEVSGADLQVNHDAITPIALIFHELATNAAKYGALSEPEGRVSISCTMVEGGVTIYWREIMYSAAQNLPEQEGFGSQLIQGTAQHLGSIRREWRDEGLTVELLIHRTHFLPDHATTTWRTL